MMAPMQEALERFVEAQDPVYDAVRSELAAASKRSHWMWFIFPQLRGLGRSSTAQHFGLAGRAEALAYWEHPVLGARLRTCIDLLLAAPPERSAREILGSPDDLKLRSCLTLFEVVAPDDPRFSRALERFYDGERDHLTLELLTAGD
jgi:uncharacterized protein (DUF1810 family)